MSFSFQVEASCGAARAGRFVTPHGEVRTPVFMPVGTVASVKGLSQELLDELGVEILLNNTYHLYLRPGVETVRQLGGVQRFMSWHKPILTDSGGFQVFSLSELRKLTEDGVQFRSHLDGSLHFFSPETSLAAEIGLGADIVMAFDECTEFPASCERARESLEASKPRPFSASCRAACTPSCAANPPGAPWRSAFPATLSAGSRWASLGRKPGRSSARPSRSCRPTGRA